MVHIQCYGEFRGYKETHVCQARYKKVYLPGLPKKLSKVRKGIVQQENKIYQQIMACSKEQTQTRTMIPKLSKSVEN